ncbi:MAG: ABC transporter substrate-binding protein, partial [Lachnospiraceae bacterium]|nr:ABC transporter substrate-binding protein [Lachnospiraceae bacterium]
MKPRRTGKKIMSFLLTAAMILSLLPMAGMESHAKTDLQMDEFDEIISTYNIDDSIPSYKDYMEQHGNENRPDRTIEVPAGGYVRYEESDKEAVPSIYSDFEGMAGDSVLTGEDSLIEFEVDVPESGLYNLSVVYYPVEGKNSDIERSVFIDGELPFEELSRLTFPRVWTNYVEDSYINENGVKIMNWEKDNQGNDV